MLIKKMRTRKEERERKGGKRKTEMSKMEAKLSVRRGRGREGWKGVERNGRGKPSQGVSCTVRISFDECDHWAY